MQPLIMLPMKPHVLDLIPWMAWPTKAIANSEMKMALAGTEGRYCRMLHSIGQSSSVQLAFGPKAIKPSGNLDIFVRSGPLEMSERVVTASS